MHLEPWYHQLSMSEEESIPKDISPAKETTPNLQRNIEEDTRFQSLLGEQNNLDTKLNALGLFREKHSDDYEAYEQHSVWYNDEGQPDVHLDLFYSQLDRDAWEEGSKRLLEVGSEHSDPNQALTTMAESYEKAHFEPIQEKFSAYKTKFPEKAEKYRKSTVEHNKHWVDMDLYAEERLADASGKPNEVALAFHKAVVLQRLGEKAPNVPSQNISKEFWGAVAIDMGGKPNSKADKRLKGWLKELRDRLIAEQPEDATSESSTPSGKK